MASASAKLMLSTLGNNITVCLWDILKVFLLYSIYKQCTKDRVFRAVVTSNLLQALHDCQAVYLKLLHSDCQAVYLKLLHSDCQSPACN